MTTPNVKPYQWTDFGAETTSLSFHEKAETLHGELFGFDSSKPSKPAEIELIRKYLVDTFERGQEFANDNR